MQVPVCIRFRLTSGGFNDNKMTKKYEICALCLLRAASDTSWFVETFAGGAELMQLAGGGASRPV